MPIIEEWTAWLLVRERERQLAREELIREAERARRRMGDAIPLPKRRRRPAASEEPPRHRRAA
ncbi:MAG TPA: hypothetical protein VFW08_01820 [bacterium]|nr:hypothetical protein [bacterium]